MQSTRMCEVERCGSVHYGLGFCKKHYRRFKKHGDPEYVKPELSVEERFWSKVKKTETCWNWTAAADKQGYGRFSVKKSEPLWLAHRLSYFWTHGSLDDALSIDHLCRNPRCVNPDHLEEVTQMVNMERSDLPWAVMWRENRCTVGHDLLEHGEYYQKNGKQYRRCRPCHVEGNRRRNRRYEARKRAGLV